MKKLLILSSLLLLLGCSSEKKPNLKPPYILENLQSMPFHASDLLKETLTKHNYKRTGDMTIVKPQQAAAFFGEMTEQYLTYLFVGAASTKYQAGDNLIYAEVLEFADATHAYGFYALKRPDGVKVERIGVEAYHEGSSLYFSRGEFVITLSADDNNESARSAMTDMATSINKELVANTMIPPYFMLFPFSGRINPSSRYFPYQFMDIQGLDDVYTSRYVVDDDTLLLFLTLDSTGEKLNWVQDYADDHGYKTAQVKKLNFDNYQGIAFDFPEKGIFLCGLKTGKLVGAIGYKPKFHNKLVSGWINGFK